MADPAPKRPMTHEEYLAFERSSRAKHELVDGEVFAMSGARRAHNRVAANVITELSNALRDRPCTVYTSDQRVRAGDGSAHYPDVSALCGDERFTDDEEDELTNPTLIVEVLSRTTEGYDRGDKFAHYRSIPSLREYVLASSDKTRVEVFVREADGWKLRTYGPGETFELASLGCALSVDELYRKVFRSA